MIRVFYPVPNENADVWEIFLPYVARFCRSWREFAPGCECELVPVLFGDDPTGAVTNHFRDLPVDQFERYHGGGCDIGAAQWVAEGSAPDDFIVALTSRVYLHRAGWLNHLYQAQKLYGVGLYGTSASREGGNAHICTRCYAMNAELWNVYPHLIDSRDRGTFFEVGAGNPIGALSDWIGQIGLPTCTVYWDGVRPKPYWFHSDNIFRMGNQENLLVWDKHTDAYRYADDEGKRRLEASCFFGVEIPIAQSTDH